MSKWEMVKIEEVCEILDSMRVPVTASDRKVGIYPYYGANGVQDYVSEYIFDDELVLLAEDGGNFGSKIKPIAYRVSGKCWVNNHAHVLKAKPMIDVDFLCYSIMFYDVSKIINGTTRAKLTQAAMRKMIIPLPPLDTQKKIAKTLDTAEELLAMRKKQLAKLDNLMKSIFYEMFGDPVSNDKGWEIKKMGEVCSKITDGKHGDCKDEVASGYFFLSAKDIENGTIQYDNARQITQADFEDTNKRTKLFPGDIVVVNTGATIGKTAIVTDNDRTYRTTFQKSVGIIQVIPSKLSNIFLQYYIIIDRENIYNSASGSAQKNWLLSQMRNYPILLPPLNLQNRFADIAMRIEEQKDLVKKAIDETQYLFNSLMSEYFE